MRSPPWLPLALTVLAGCVLSPIRSLGGAYADQEPARPTAVLSLKEEMQVLQQQIVELRSQLERLEQENQQLRDQVRALASTKPAAVSADVLQSQLVQMRAEMESMRRDILNRTAQAVEELGRRTQASLDAAARASGPRPAAASGGTARPDLPPNTEGIVYTVQPGDTLSKIAARFRTTVAVLRQANNLSGDSIRIGDNIFIPQAAPAR